MTDGAVFWSAASPGGSVAAHVCFDAERDGVSARDMRDAGWLWSLGPEGMR